MEEGVIPGPQGVDKMMPQAHRKAPKCWAGNAVLDLLLRKHIWFDGCVFVNLSRKPQTPFLRALGFGN